MRARPCAQDIAWSLPAAATVGYVSYPSVFGYYPCKNDIATAARLSTQGVPPYGAGDGTFPCHPTAVTVSATLTALLAPLSLGLLRRVRYVPASRGKRLSWRPRRLHLPKRRRR